MVIFYTTHCPKCNILKKKLNDKNIQYEEVTDVNIMIKKGFTQSPILDIDNKILNFNEAIRWIQQQ